MSDSFKRTVDRSITAPPTVSSKKVERVTILEELPSGNIRLELGADGLYLLFDCDCLDALPFCKAHCCSLQGILLDEDEASEFEALYPIEPNDRYQAYEMRRDADGFCACLDRETRQCQIYSDRPQTCRQYHCTKGAWQRGWKLPNDTGHRLRER